MKAYASILNEWLTGLEMQKSNHDSDSCATHQSAITYPRNVSALNGLLGMPSIMSFK